jgi:glutathione S-transferase
VRACPGQTASCVACVHCTHARKCAREPCTQRKSSRTCICRALAHKLKEVIHKVEAAIVGPFMRGDSFSLADVAAAPFFQVL